jgi:hypothetical protein
MNDVYLPSLDPVEAGAPADEIEISPAMLAAGAAVLADIYDDGVDWLTEDQIEINDAVRYLITARAEARCIP